MLAVGSARRRCLVNETVLKWIYSVHGLTALDVRDPRLRV